MRRHVSLALLFCSLLALVSGGAWASTLWYTIRDFPAPDVIVASTPETSVSDSYAVWAGKGDGTGGYPNDPYYRIYAYDLYQDTDADYWADWMDWGTRAASVPLSPCATADRRNPDICDDKVVYEYRKSANDYDIMWTDFAHPNQEHVVTSTTAHQTQPRISKYNGRYYVVWQEGTSSTSIKVRRLPTTYADCTDPIRTVQSLGTTPGSPDVGDQWIVCYGSASSGGIFRASLSNYDSGNPTASKITGTTSASFLPGTDGQYVAYLEDLPIGNTLMNQVYAVSTSDFNTRILVVGRPDELGPVPAGMQVTDDRPGVANGIVSWHIFQPNPGNPTGPIIGVFMADIQTNKDYPGDYEPLVQRWSTGGGFEDSGAKTFSVASDRVLMVENLTGAHFRPTMDLLRTNLTGEKPGPGFPAAAYVSEYKDETVVTQTAKVFVRNTTADTWTSANFRILPTTGTENLVGHGGDTGWPLKQTWLTSPWKLAQGVSVPPRGLAVLSYPDPDGAQTKLSAPVINGVPEPGRYAFDWKLQYKSGTTWYDYPAQMFNQYRNGSETEYGDLTKVRQDLYFVSFVDVGTYTSRWDEIEACHYHWRELGKSAIVGGYDGATYNEYRPDVGLTRDQLCVYVYRADQSPAYTPPPTPTFTDVPTNYWCYKEIEYCHSQGIVNGYGDGTFRPTNAVDRASGSVFLLRATCGDQPGDPNKAWAEASYTAGWDPEDFYYDDCDDAGDASWWARNSIYWMASNTDGRHLRSVFGYSATMFGGTTQLTRGEMALFVTYAYRLTEPTMNFQAPW